MCGISGIFNFSPVKIDENILTRMNTIQSHRGPDDHGFYFGEGIGLGHRRLSIIDIEAGHQPIFNHQKTTAIVFNGEIYNFKELTKELEEKGCKFQTHSDTEAIIHAWDEWGVECVHKLRGMFAFAIWDDEKKTLFIARDRLGIKPLYYSCASDGSVVFGSELKVVLEHPSVTREIDEKAVEDYFSLGYIPEPRSIFCDTFKLEPGHYLLLEQGDKNSVNPIEYWDLPFSSDSSSDEITLENFNTKLSEAVGIRMVSEVPIGAFLSGGVDSSAVVAHMANLQSNPVNTCSIGFDVKDYNESEFAEMVATKYNTNHKTKVVDVDDYTLLDELIDLYDEPFADPSALPTYRVCELAKESVTVALSGDGGDELFAGYRNHYMHKNEEKVRSAMPLWLRKPLFGFLGKVYPKLDWAPKFVRAKTTFQSLGYDDIEGFHNSMSIQRKEQLTKLYSSSFKAKLSGYSSLDIFRRHGNKYVGKDSLKRAQYIDFKTYLPGDILTKVDRASMAHSLEVRVPLIDHKFVEWAFQIPSTENLQGSNGKAYFKKSLEEQLPHDVLYRKKMGFSVPLETWFRGPLASKIEQKLLSGSLSQSKFFNMAYVEEMIREHVSGKKNYDTALWSLLMFNAFLEKYEL